MGTGFLENFQLCRPLIVGRIILKPIGRVRVKFYSGEILKKTLSNFELKNKNANFLQIGIINDLRS